MVKIFVDPGHGGSDPGAIANGLQEKDVCLQIALKMKKFLREKYSGHQIKMSRTIDRALSLKERTDMANRWGADYLVSVHINAGGGTGFESYIYNGSYTNKMKTNRLREFIHDEIVGVTQFKDRGKKEANFHMLRESQMPAILTENGFIDTISDANQLKDKKFLRKIARGHTRGIAKAFGLRNKNESEAQVLQYDAHLETSDELNRSYHLVQQGDTLWSIAKRYGTTVDQLMKWNEPIIPERLQIGRKIIIDEDYVRKSYHTIQKDDTLWSLAVKYGTTVNRLQKLNIDVDPKHLQIGRRVRVR